MFLLLAVAGCAASRPAALPTGDLRQQDETLLCTSRAKVLDLPSRTFALAGELGRLSLTAVGELRWNERLLGRLEETGCFRAPDGEVLAEWGQSQMIWMREPHPYLRIGVEAKRLTLIGKGGFRSQTTIEGGRIRGPYDHSRWKVLGPEPHARPELALRMELLQEMFDARCEGEPFVELPDDDLVLEHENGTRIVLTTEGVLSQAGLVVGRLEPSGCFFDPLGNWAARWTRDGRLIQRGDASWGYMRFRLKGLVQETYSGDLLKAQVRFDGSRLVPRKGRPGPRLLAPHRALRPGEVATLLRAVLLPDLMRLAGQRGPDALGDPTSL